MHFIFKLLSNAGDNLSKSTLLSKCRTRMKLASVCQRIDLSSVRPCFLKKKTVLLRSIKEDF